MKKEITVTAKTVEEAKEKAVAELGIPADRIEFTVVEEGKKGFLGIGATDAKITATYSANGADIAEEFIRRVIDDMGLDLTVEVKMTAKDEALISIDGDGAGVLIGHHGETLDALQHLTNLAANKKVEGEKRDFIRVNVDVERYRAKREDTLRALARRMAEKVVKYKKSVMLEPMNPYERRIIHSEVQGIGGVSTSSIGADKNRRVVIFLDDGNTAAVPEDDLE